MLRQWRRFILHFANEHIDFRLPEIQSIAAMFSFEVKLLSPFTTYKSPFLVVEVPTEECARHLMARSVLLRSVYEYWASGTSLPELFNAIKQLPPEFLEPHKTSTKSFRIVAESFNKQLSMAEKIQKIESFLTQCVNFNGKVNLSSPERSFHILETYQESRTEPSEVLFGKWLGDGQRDLPSKYDLKKRKFIGNTSMDPCLATLMANQGHAGPGKFAFDPFVGTGGLLVASAHWGCYVAGADLDYQVIHGCGKSSRSGAGMRGSDENIYNNMLQYGLEQFYIDVLIVDSSRHKLWRERALFDLIITDPPYGIREPSKKVGTFKTDTTITEESRTSHIPSKVFYSQGNVYKDLLNFAARYLVLGGKLVFWLPYMVDVYSEKCIPTHPCLKLLHNSEQRFNTKVGRRLVTMEKSVSSTDETILNGADLQFDPFLNKSFRDQYFGVDAIYKEKHGHKDPKVPSRNQLKKERRRIQEEHMKAKVTPSVQEDNDSDKEKFSITND